MDEKSCLDVRQTMSFDDFSDAGREGRRLFCDETSGCVQQQGQVHVRHGLVPVQALANGNWLGRHPEILRQMPYAHRLLLPSARVISQRVVFAAGNGQDWEKAFKQKGMEGIVLVVGQEGDEQRESPG